MHDANIYTDTLSRLLGLEKWIEQNGMAGYDPYDLRGTTLYRKVRAIRGGKDLLSLGERLAPVLIRRLFSVKPEVNPKAVGLLALGHLTRFSATGDAKYRERAIACLNWLETNSNKQYSGMCWGYPFDWHTRITIPRGTPSAVVSSIAGWAFLKAYRVLKEPRYLDVAASISRFFVNDLNIDRSKNGSICFSYTPLDNFHVHNVNLFVAAHLMETGNLTGDFSHRSLAEAAVAYTLSEQTPQGAWYYWGNPDNHDPHVDHYHTGFVLRCLDRVCRVGGGMQWLESLQRGFTYYISRLFDASGLPKPDPDNAYPVDVHGCAEAVLCLTQLQPRFPFSASLLNKTLQWTLNSMQDKDGHFHYRKYPRYSIRIPFLRWGQSWMYWALAEHTANMRFTERK